MTLRDLIQDSNIWKDALSLICVKYESEGFPDPDGTLKDEVNVIYTNTMMRLLAFPYNPQDFLINISLIPKDEFNDEEYVDISLLDPIKNLQEDIAVLPWSELIDLDLKLDTCVKKYSKPELLSELLWEFTIWGFESDVSAAEVRSKFSTFVSGFLSNNIGKN